MDPKHEEQVNNEEMTSKKKSTQFRVAVVFVALVVGLCVAILIGTENASENQDRIYQEQTKSYSDETEDTSDSSTGGSYKSYSHKDSDYSSNDSTTNERKHGAYYPETDEYTSPEDFYYNFRDDFMDYDEAEEYYYENGGE